jgi:hypothetical protein
VAVGSINWYLKRLVNKGYVKVRQMQRRRLRYLLTPQGVAEKARLTSEYLKASLRIYRETRIEAQRLLTQVTDAGYDTVWIEGDGDLADICLLTCLERNVDVATSEDATCVPTLTVEGMGLTLRWPPMPSDTEE